MDFIFSFVEFLARVLSTFFWLALRSKALYEPSKRW